MAFAFPTFRTWNINDSAWTLIVTSLLRRLARHNGWFVYLIPSVFLGVTEPEIDGEDCVIKYDTHEYTHIGECILFIASPR